MNDSSSNAELDEIAARFDERSASYDESGMHRGLASAVGRFVRFGGVSDVLDVATGTGLVLRNLPASHARLVGIDISSRMLEVAHAKLPTALFLVGDAHRLPFADASFDLVTCVTALHLADASRVLSECRRVLRRDGRTVLATFATDQESRKRSGRIGHGATPEGVHARLGTTGAIEGLAALSGLRLVRSVLWDYADDDGVVTDVCLLSELVVA